MYSVRPFVHNSAKNTVHKIHLCHYFQFFCYGSSGLIDRLHFTSHRLGKFGALYLFSRFLTNYSLHYDFTTILIFKSIPQAKRFFNKKDLGLKFGSIYNRRHKQSWNGITPVFHEFFGSSTFVQKQTREIQFQEIF